MIKTYLSDMADRLDIIGDIHGCEQTLIRLLTQLGYQKHNGVYRHPERLAVFLGDIIDRGPRIREALNLVRSMVEAGCAKMILGNHEVHALCYCSAHPSAPGNYIRPHTPRNTHTIAATLEQFAAYPDEWQDHLQWLKTLPLYLDFGQYRVVHACWDDALITARSSARLSEDELTAMADPASATAQGIKRLTSGFELALPDDCRMFSAEGYRRRSFRAKFWVNNPACLGDLEFQPDALPDAVAQQPVDSDLKARLVVYDSDQPPVFVGHYWLSGKPAPVASNVACLDYSAVKFGRLVAYQTDASGVINSENFVWIYVDP
ncbi:metallophosphoesterase [Gilvimarinus polysaccharolyticus]|uniref:metallophosphoesterase n=1 Tax=Gilvimarinus polysaccharolyticus TaxID=863921 RepID=UPI000AB50A96|nr:metallophosphoesterase [Gilvimarinus polysaccharolyticus]